MTSGLLAAIAITHEMGQWLIRWLINHPWKDLGNLRSWVRALSHTESAVLWCFVSLVLIRVRLVASLHQHINPPKSHLPNKVYTIYHLALFCLHPNLWINIRHQVEHETLEVTLRIINSLNHSLMKRSCARGRNRNVSIRFPSCQRQYEIIVCP